MAATYHDKFEDSLKQELYLSTASNSSMVRATLSPQRDNGRRRVAVLLDAAAAVIAERGFAAATMAEIAARADTRIGSLYRFFPNKAAIADALTERYASFLDAEFADLVAASADASPDTLAEMLSDLLIRLRPRTWAMTALLDPDRDLTEVRIRFRARTLVGVKSAILACAPHLEADVASDVAAVALNVMKALAAMVLEDAPSTAGAPAEMRLMLRLYLRLRLAAPEV